MGHNRIINPLRHRVNLEENNHEYVVVNEPNYTACEIQQIEFLQACRGTFCGWVKYPGNVSGRLFSVPIGTAARFHNRFYDGNQLRQEYQIDEVPDIVFTR